jgi:hypothetical protein
MGICVFNSCAATRHDLQGAIFTQEQMQRQYQEFFKIHQHVLENRKTKNVGLNEALEFTQAQNIFEDMKRERIPDFLFKKYEYRNSDSKLFHAISRVLLQEQPRLAKTQQNLDGTRQWMPYDWAYKYYSSHNSGDSGFLPYSFSTYTRSGKKTPFDPVSFVERAEKKDIPIT